MISAYGDKDTVALASQRGAEKFLSKPVDFPQRKLDVSTVIADAQSAPKADGP